MYFSSRSARQSTSCNDTSSSSYQSHQFQKSHFRFRLHLDPRIQALHLPLVNQNDEAIALKSLDSLVELFLTIQRLELTRTRVVMRLLHLPGLKQAVKLVRLPCVVLGHFALDACADELTHSQAVGLQRKLEHVLIAEPAVYRFVFDG